MRGKRNTGWAKLKNRADIVIEKNNFLSFLLNVFFVPKDEVLSLRPDCLVILHLYGTSFFESVPKLKKSTIIVPLHLLR